MVSTFVPMKDRRDKLSVPEVRTFLDSIDIERDFLLFAGLFQWGCRIGELVGNKARRCLRCSYFYHTTQAIVKDQDVTPSGRTRYTWGTRYARECPKCGSPEYDLEIKGGLRSEDIDIENCCVWLHWEKVKGDERIRKKTVPELLDRLLAYAEHSCYRDNDLVFKISRQRVHQLMKKYAKKAGLDYKRVHIHQLRHTATTMYAKKAKSRYEKTLVSKVIGHKDPKMTDYYADEDEEAEETFVNKVFKDFDFSKRRRK